MILCGHISNPTETTDGLGMEICQHDSSHTGYSQTLYATGTWGLSYEYIQNSLYTGFYVSGYQGTATDMYIPTYYAGVPVLYVSSNVFRGNTQITSIFFGNNVKWIKSGSFENCTALRSVIFSDSVKEIRDSAFKGCTNLESVIFGSGLLKIGAEAFRFCESLTTLIISDGVQQIGNDAFGRAYGLTRAIVPDSIVSMGEGVFYMSSELSIYCKSASAKSGWHSEWQAGNKAVYWAGEWHMNGDQPQPHCYGEWQQITAPSWTEKGLQERYCPVCGHTDRQEIEALGHEYGEWETVTPATCTVKGNEKRICAVCGHEEHLDTDALGHTLGDWITIVHPTCTINGAEQRSCSVCDYFEQRQIIAFGHTYGDWETVSPATCTQSGTEVRICSVCGHEDHKAIQPLEHNYVWIVTTTPTETEDGEETEICTHDPAHTRDTRISYATGTEGLGFTYDSLANQYTVSEYNGTATNVYIPAYYNRLPVTYLVPNAFAHNKTITSVTLPYTMETIHAHSFMHCTNLVSINFPENSRLRKIGNGAFYKCISLTSLVLPDSVEDMGDLVFEDCENMIYIIIPHSVKWMGQGD